VNTDAPFPEADGGLVAGTERSRPSCTSGLSTILIRRFDDLWNLVYDPDVPG